MAFWVTIQFGRVNPPKPFCFIILNQNSAIDPVVVTALGASGLIGTIVRLSAYLFSVGILINTFSHNIEGIFVPTLIYYMQSVLDNSLHIHRLASAYLEYPNVSHNMLSQLHQYLTPYIISHESI